MGMRVRNVKAYTAFYDEKARFPKKNFLDIINKELKDGSYKNLVIGGGSVDITNLDTCTEPEKNIEDFSWLVVNVRAANMLSLS